MESDDDRSQEELMNSDDYNLDVNSKGEVISSGDQDNIYYAGDDMDYDDEDMEAFVKLPKEGQTEGNQFVQNQVSQQKQKGTRKHYQKTSSSPYRELSDSPDIKSNTLYSSKN